MLYSKHTPKCGHRQRIHKVWTTELAVAQFSLKCIIIDTFDYLTTTTTTLYFPLLEYYFHIIEYKNN